MKSWIKLRVDMEKRKKGIKVQRKQKEERKRKF